MGGIGLGLLFVSIWASAFTAIKGIVPEWPALWALATRFVLVTPLLAGIVLLRGVVAPSRRAARSIARAATCSAICCPATTSLR